MSASLQPEVTDLRRTGIGAVGAAPWGTHFCQFYASKEDLTDVLVPYFKAGLESGEFCMWVTSPPLGVEEAWAALAAAVPDLDGYRERGQLEILAHTDWYLLGGHFDRDRVLQGWVDKLERALARGWAGLRLTGNTFWLEKADWRGFAEYEAAVDSVLGNYRMLALCSYSLERCGAAEIADVIKNHQFALLKRDGAWDLIESFERQRLHEQHLRALSLERERLAVTLQSIGDAVIATDVAGRVTSVNAIAEQLTGWREAEAVGRPLSEVYRVLDAKSGAPAPDPARAVLEEGRASAADPSAPPKQLRARDGRSLFVSETAAPIRGRGPSPLGVVLVFRDVTEPRGAAMRQRESEARLGLLSRTASKLLASEEPQAVVNELCREVMQHLDCHAFFNFLVEPAAGKLRLNACAGVPEAEAKRIEWLDIGVAVCGCVAECGRRIIAEDIQNSADPRADLVRSYGIQAYCCHPLLAEGRVLGTLSFGTRSRPRFTADEVELMRTVADQVATAMQRVESKRALSRANEQLREEDRRKNEFLAVLSHELRNPLAPIRNSLFILDRAAPGGEQARRAQQVIDRQVLQLSNLVNDLLDITRITRNKIQLQKERLELNEVVRRVIEDNRSLFDRASVRVELSTSPRAIEVEADGTRLAQIVGNLLHNSAKFTPAGGRARVTVAAEGAQALVRVVDDGVGIAPETLTRLFEPFTQAEQTLDRSKGGLGLGLALVKGLVELHGGRITAHSDGPGRGAEFVLRLPVFAPAGATANDAARASSSVVGEGAAARGRRILIIEDNRDAADSLREALELGSHEVRVAYSGDLGLELARGYLPEVVLCDIGLPGMTGYEVAQAFRADAELSRAHLVALSGYALPEDLERAAAAGFAQHLAKPPDLAKLEALLAKVAEAAQGAASSLPRPGEGGTGFGGPILTCA